MQLAVGTIRKNSMNSKEWFWEDDKLLEAERISQRTNYDMEMMMSRNLQELENYSRHRAF